MVPQPKAVIDFEHGALTIDAAVIGRGLNVEPSLVPVRMREGRITVLCERGYDRDAGRHRLTFFYKNRRFRLVVDEEGPTFNSRLRQAPASHFYAQALSMTDLNVQFLSDNPSCG